MRIITAIVRTAGGGCTANKGNGEMRIIDTKDFAVKVATVMRELSSSHVYFILQQAYGDDLDWTEASLLLDNVINEPRPTPKTKE